MAELSKEKRLTAPRILLTIRLLNLANLANLDLYLARLARARVSIDTLAKDRNDLPPQAEPVEKDGAL